MDKRNLQNNTRGLHAQPPYTGIKNVLGTVYKEGGVRGLYRGVGIYALALLVFKNLLLCVSIIAMIDI